MSIDFTVKVKIPQHINTQSQEFQTRLFEAVRKSTYSDLHGDCITVEFEDYSNAIKGEMALNEIIEYFNNINKEPLSQEQYLYQLGQHCPNCISNNINKHQAVILDFNLVYQACNCNKCDATWNDTYKLINYSELKTIL